VDVQLSWWAADLGRAAFQLLTRGLAPLVIGAVTIGFALPGSWTAYPLGLVSVLLAVSLSFIIRFGVNLIAFWSLDIRGFIGLYLVIVAPFSGLYVPVHLFPDWLRTIAYATPFPSLLQFPIDVLSGRVLGLDAVVVVAMQAGWLVLLVVLTRVLMARAARRLVVQGG
jgi:ABC-2 type transport system permease protein